MKEKALSILIDIFTARPMESSVQRSEEFHSGTGRDGIEAQSRDPGIFRDGISLIFQSRDCLEIVWDFSGFFVINFFDAISDYLE